MNPRATVEQRPLGNIAKGISTDETVGRQIIPDVVIEVDDEIRGVVEVKWSMDGPAKDHFYQLLSYLTVAELDTGVIVYPSLSDIDESVFETPDDRRIHLVDLQSVLRETTKNPNTFGSRLETHLGMNLPFEITSR